MIRDFFIKSGIRKKLVASYLVTIIILAAISIYSYYNARIVLDKLEAIIIDHVYLNELSNDANNLVMEVEQYLSTASSDNLLNYYSLSDTLHHKASYIPREIQYEQEALMLKNIGYMIESLLEEADLAVTAKRGRIGSEYVAHFARISEINNYIRLYINNLLNLKLMDGAERYQVISVNMTYLSYLNILIIALAVLLNVILAVYFSHRLTKPIVELAYSADRVAGGDFDIAPVAVHTNDEINILANAFNKMTFRIKNYIEKLKSQAEFEARLQSQEMENLEMKNLLKEAELKSLQSQINPHFLFNTLNTASQLAMLEGAERSSEFIENVAQLCRYNLRRLDQPITLQEEIDHVLKYMYIIQVRFGDKIEFHTEIDRRLVNLQVPCIILQPIVENAFIHGLSKRDGHGFISLVVRGDNGNALIEVTDNGLGMGQPTIDTIMLAGSNKSFGRCHATGMGMNNVINRLKLFYNIEDSRDLIQILSALGQGTRITLKLPHYNREGRQ